MIKVLILAFFVIAIGLFIAKFLFKKQDNDVIDGEVIDAEAKPRRSSLLPILLLGAVLAGIGLFVLPRFGFSVIGLLQKAIALLSFIRGFLAL